MALLKENMAMESQSPGLEILQLLPYDAPLLRQQASTVTFPLSPSDHSLLANMLYSVQDEQLAVAKAPWPSAAGMAAPQWGVSRRVFVIQTVFLAKSSSGGAFQGGEDKFTVVINPEYVALTPEQTVSESGSLAPEVVDWEGCFSVPGKRGRVRRYQTIRATFFTQDGVEHCLVLTGWPARVFQHETDHTEGRLYDDQTAGRCSQLVDVPGTNDLA